MQDRQEFRDPANQQIDKCFKNQPVYYFKVGRFAEVEVGVAAYPYLNFKTFAASVKWYNALRTKLQEFGVIWALSGM